jgi:hypothetical protein
MNDFHNSPIDHFPDISKITFKAIDKAFLKVILIHVFLVFGLLFVGLFFLVKHEIKDEFPEFYPYFFLGLFVVFMLVLALKLVGFKKRKYAVREKDISYKSGVFFKKMTTVPFTRIQHIEVDEGPVSRLFKLASLSVFTAGDSSDDLEINGIKKETALEIKEFISQKIDE